MRRTSLVDIDAECEVFEDSDDMSINEVQCEDTGKNKSSSQNNVDAILQLDDEDLFGIIQKLACNGLRQILSGFSGPNAGTSSIPLDCLGIGTHRGVVSIKKTDIGIDVCLFSKVIDKLSPEKKLVIKAYGFESLLSFDKCEIPLPFARWLADHVDVRKSQIVVKDMCVPMSPQLVNDVIGIPMGAKTIANEKSGSVKHDFLSVMGFNSLPSASTCAENLLKDGLSDDDFVRNFLIVAMVTFLCPNSNNYPSRKYLQPLIDVKAAKEWDWCKFVHLWLLNEIKKYNLLMKKATHSSVFLGGCLYLICVLYLDFLDIGKELLPSIFPRIKVWKGVMIREYSEFDCVGGHFYGKHQIKQLQCTCYGKRNSTRTPSPSCNIDGCCFKKRLAESVSANLSPRTLDDVTALYLKHATSNELVPVHVESAIVDVINYFCHRAQADHIPHSEDDSDFVAPENVNKSEAADVCNSDPKEIHVDGTVVVFPRCSDGNPHDAHTGVHRTLADASLLNDDGHIIHDEIATDVVHESDLNARRYADGCHAPIFTIEVVPNENGLHGCNTIVPIVGNQKDTSSGDTLVLPSSEGYSSSVKAIISNTEIISSSSPTLSDSVQLYQGVSLKRKRVSSPITSLNIGVVGSTVAGRTQSQRLSLSPEADANQSSFMDNPQDILRKNKKERITTKMREICQSLNTTSNAVDVEDNIVTLANKSASSSYMVREDICSPKSRELEPPSVDVCHGGPIWDFGLPNSTKSAAVNVNSWNFLVPTFNVLNESDDSAYVASHNEIFNGPEISDANINAQNNGQDPVYDESPPDDVPLSTLDTAGRFVATSTQEVHADVYATGQRSSVNECNVVISGERQVNGFQNIVAPTFNFLKKSDDYVDLQNEIFNGPKISDANINAQNNDQDPVYDESPLVDVVPLAALDTACRLVATSSQEIRADVHATGQRSDLNEFDVIKSGSGERQVNDFQNIMSQEAEKIYDANDGSCFRKCQQIGFNLGSSSKGEIGKSRRPRRIVQPNSYFRDFQINVCNARFIVALPEKLVYDCVLFYSQFPEHARAQVINYDNVRVTFEEFGSSMRRAEKQSVHHHVVNAFCRKLFKDKHPRQSRRHYFFSPVGDYLMNHDYEGNNSYLHDNCERCFKLANGSHNFKSSDFLFFPIFHETHWFVFVVALRDGYFVFLDSFFSEDNLYQQEVRAIVIPNFLKAWDEFVNCDWNFHEFVVHYAAVPQQDRRFSGSKFDDGIFVMKFLELWDPCINMMVQFSSSHIQELRMLLVNSMIFSKHNSCNDAKNLVLDHKSMVALRSLLTDLPLSMF